MPTVHDEVIDTAAEVLAVDRPSLVAADPLTELPTFSSFRVVDIVERLEERLGVEIDPADLRPENLHHLDALCELFARSAAGAKAV
ncbi:acyl carrier protein [Actinomadura verrucosospora]|uniref:Phosphopantetheine-binding-protein n=1 Tax=Actinomadura verrucosospora TaxID=46165 RepID=A0A7D4AK14_ACTVE|nr:acyl carrier protein [Actinomadura verrucosospora]QKG18509.1 phosphopantetheine-binding-protein [Actinomadura verrucosospora]